MIFLYIAYAAAYLYYLGSNCWDKKWFGNELILIALKALLVVIFYLSMKKLKKKKFALDMMVGFVYLYYLLMLQNKTGNWETAFPPTIILLIIVIYFSIRLIMLLKRAESNRSKIITVVLVLLLNIAAAPVLYTRKGSAAYTYAISSVVPLKQLNENELVFGNDSHYGMTVDLKYKDGLSHKEETDLHWQKQKRIGPWIISYFAGYG